MMPKITTTTTLSDSNSEPRTARDARITYWMRRHEVDAVEARICARSDRALEWVMRVKRI